MTAKAVAGAYVAMALVSLMLASLWSFNSFAPSAPQGFPIVFYQRAVSQLDGRSCPSYPACSQYARQALAEHGMVLGSWLMLDRLIHEGGDMEHGLRIIDHGEQLLYDPLKRNDFWLRRGEK